MEHRLLRLFALPSSSEEIYKILGDCVVSFGFLLVHKVSLSFTQSYIKFFNSLRLNKFGEMVWVLEQGLIACL